MAKLTKGTNTQPAANNAVSIHQPIGLVTFQITRSSGRQKTISAISAKHDASIYVLRSIGSGIRRVHQRLKAGRAITECCRLNTNSSTTLITTAEVVEAGGPKSMVRGSR